jgi:hypothetical protein
MTQIALLLLAALAATGGATPKQGSPCKGNEDLLAIPGKWTTRTDVGRGPAIPANAATEVVTRIDRIGQLFRAAYPEPKGMIAAGYRDLDSPQLIEGGPYPYAYRSLYLGWYCNTNLKKLMLAGETSTWAYAFVNQLTWFAEPQKNLQVQGQSALLLTRRVANLKGVPAYEGIHNQSSNTGPTFSRAILVTRPGRSPLKAVTRKQFLEAYLAGIEAQVEPMLADIERAKLDPARKVTLVEQRRDQMSKLQAAARARLSSLSPQEAEQPAFVTPANVVQFKDFTPESQGGRALVRLDRAYLQASVARYAPQFVVVYWRWQRGVPSENFRTEFERRFDPSLLARLLDN